MREQYGPWDYLKELKKEEDIIEVELPEEFLNKLYEDSPIISEIIKDRKKIKRDRDTMLEGMFNELISAISMERKRNIQEQIAIGELLLKGINATLRKAEDNYRGYVIIINRGLTTFFYNMTKLILAMAATFPELERCKPTIKPILSFDEVVSLSRHLLTLYHEGKVPELPVGKVVIKNERLNLLASLEVYAIFFVISHELAHFLHNHLDQLHMDTKDKEFEADETGFTILLNHVYGKRDDVEIMKAVAGSQLVLHYIEFVEKTGRFESSTHPPAEERINRLRERFEFSKIYYDMFDAFVTLSRDILKKVK